MAREIRLARALVEMADTLVEDFDVVELLTRLTDSCVEVLEVNGAAGLVLTGPSGDLRIVASSSEAINVLELFELQSQEGPCLDCFRTGGPVVNQNLEETNGRWPRFVAEALSAGFKSVHALPLRLRGNVIGALGLFSSDIGPIDPPDVDAAQALADVATIAILQHRAAIEAQTLNEQLTHALNARVLIEQAKGMIAERLSVEMSDAFACLLTYARANKMLLARVATGVIDGDLAASDLVGSTPR